MLIEMIVRVARKLLVVSTAVLGPVALAVPVALIEALLRLHRPHKEREASRRPLETERPRFKSGSHFLRSSSVSGDLRDRCCAELSDRRVCGTRRSFVLASPPKRHGSPSVVEPVRNL